MKPITDIRLNRVKKYPDCIGDTWDPAWAADGSVYFAGNDGSGVRKACANNLFYNRAIGADPFDLDVETIAAMTDYGGWGQRGPDGCTWKSSGSLALDGALYLAVGRHRYGTESGDPHRRQTARRASLIRSTDSGRTWQRSAEDNYLRPMFPGQRFATPYFIHYGQEQHIPAVDGANRYVYALSNNGFWCNGDDYVLGRAARELLPRLDPADWEFYRGGDGWAAASWTANPFQAVPLIRDPLHCGESGATYIPALGCYVLIAWYYPGDPNVETDETRWVFYTSPHPWGPWRKIKEIPIRPEGWYCPRILSAWQTPVEDGLKACILTGGDYYEMDRHYCLTLVEVEFSTRGMFVSPPKPRTVRIMPGDDRIHLRGAWDRRSQQYPELFCADPGASLSLRFWGSRVRWIASKENNRGIASVQLDNQAPMFVDQYTYCAVPQPHREIFDSGEFPPGEHKLTIHINGSHSPNSSGTGIAFEYFDIFY